MQLLNGVTTKRSSRYQQVWDGNEAAHERISAEIVLEKIKDPFQEEKELMPGLKVER